MIMFTDPLQPPRRRSDATPPLKGGELEKAIAELTNVAAEYVQQPVYLYGRPHGFAGPTLHKASSMWVVRKMFAARPAEKIVTLVKGSFKATREGESPDHLIEMSRSAAMVLDLEEFVLAGEHVERVQRRIREQRQF